MKKLAYSLLIVMIVALSIFLFISCGEDKQDADLAQVTVKFMIGDKVYSETTYKEGDEVNKPEITEYGAYTISHWTVNGTSKRAFFPYEVGKTDLTFYAYTKHNISVSFYADGENVSTKKYENTELVIAAEAPSIEGYKFMGWQLDEDIVTFPYSLKDVDEDTLRFDAIYEKLCKVEFLSFGESYSTLYYTTDSTMIIPETPKVDGYSFIYWEDSNGKRLSGRVTVNSDLQYTARFEKDLYTVNYYIGQSTTPYKTLYTSSKAIDLKYDGDEDFYGWYTTTSFATRYDFSKALTKSVDIYGRVYKNDYAILRSFGTTQRAAIDTSSFASLNLDTTFPTNVSLTVSSSTVKAVYTFTTSDKKKGTIVYDMFAGTLTGTYGTNEAGISIGFDPYDYTELNLNNYRYNQTTVNSSINPKLKTIALKVAEVAYNHIHSEYLSAKTEVITTGNALPEIAFNVSAYKSGKSIVVDSDTTFYSLKVYSEEEGAYVNYYQNGKNLTISNLSTGTYVLTFAFEKTIDNYKIRQYHNIQVTI